MTNITWHIFNLDRKLSDGAVYTAHWSVTGTREVIDSTDLTTTLYGTVNLGAPDPNNFIPYEDLKESDVIDWVLNAFGAQKVEDICNSLESQLDIKQAPVKASGIPW